MSWMYGGLLGPRRKNSPIEQTIPIRPLKSIGISAYTVWYENECWYENEFFIVVWYKNLKN